jgi:hypothetical protein
MAGLRFFFARTLKRRFPPDSRPYPKDTHHRVPSVLSPEEVAQLIDAASFSHFALHPTGTRFESLLVVLECQRSCRPRCGLGNSLTRAALFGSDLH